MRSAVLFFPSSITLLVTCVTRRERWTGSGSMVRTVAAERRGMGFLLLFYAVLGAAFFAVADAGGVERPADDLVAHAREVLDAAAAHEHDRVLLQVVPLAGDVGRDLHRARDANAGALAQGRVRLLGRGRVHARADAPPLRRGDLLLVALAGLQAGGGHLAGLGLTALADELARGGHAAGHGSRPPAGVRPRQPPLVPPRSGKTARMPDPLAAARRLASGVTGATDDLRRTAEAVTELPRLVGR